MECRALLIWASVCVWPHRRCEVTTVDQGAAIMIRDNNGRTAQHIADEYGHDEIVSIIAEVNRLTL